MFQMVLGVPPNNGNTFPHAAMIDDDVDDGLDCANDTDDTGGPAIWSLTDADPDETTESSGDAPDWMRGSYGADVDTATGEPLFVRGADITAPDDSPTKPSYAERPMNCAGPLGGFSPRGLSLIEMIRMRDPRAKTIVPAYC